MENNLNEWRSFISDNGRLDELQPFSTSAKRAQMERKMLLRTLVKFLWKKITLQQEFYARIDKFSKPFGNFLQPLKKENPLGPVTLETFKIPKKWPTAEL